MNTKRSLWLSIIFVIAVVIFSFGLFLFINSRNQFNERIASNVIESYSSRFSSIELEERIMFKGKFTSAILEDQGLLFPEIKEDIADKYKLDFEDDSVTFLGGELPALGPLDSFSIIDEELVTSDLFKEILDNRDFFLTETPEGFEMSFGYEPTMIFIESRVEDLINQRFEGVEISDLVIDINGEFDLRLFLDKNYKRVGITYSVQNVEASFNLAGESMSVLITETGGDPYSRLVIENYSYELLATSR